MKCYSSDEPALGLKAMYAKVIVLAKRDLNYKLKLISNDDWCKKKKKKRFEFFYTFALEKTR